MDIVERLRDRISPNVGLSLPPTYFKDPLCQQAADEIELLRKERDGLREAVIEIVYRIGQGDTLGAMEIAAPIAEAALKETE